MKTYRKDNVEWWFDRSCFSWVVRSIDNEGNQLGNADYVGTKSDRDMCIKTRLRNAKVNRCDVPPVA